MKALQRSSLATGDKPQLSDITLVNDDLFRWRFRVKNFDEDVAAGRVLNKDLKEMGRKYGQDYLLMEIQFPPDYPTNPFFLRLVSPRCVMYTGHVTAGGSICIEALVATGGPGGWRADYSVEGILVLVLANMLHAEVTTVRTATGPGGVSGPLRVDLSRGSHCLAEYSMGEAKSAYERTVANHGWTSRAVRGAGPSAAPAAAGAAAAAAAAAGNPAAAAGSAPSGTTSTGDSPAGRTRSRQRSALPQRNQQPTRSSKDGGGAVAAAAAAPAAAPASATGAGAPGAAAAAAPASKRALADVETVDLLDDDDDDVGANSLAPPGARGARAARNRSRAAPGPAAAAAAPAPAPLAVPAQPPGAAGGRPTAPQRKRPAPVDDDGDDVILVSENGTPGRAAPAANRAAGAAGNAAGPSARGRRSEVDLLDDSDDEVMDLQLTQPTGGAAAAPRQRGGGAAAGAAAARRVRHEDSTEARNTAAAAPTGTGANEASSPAANGGPGRRVRRRLQSPAGAAGAAGAPVAPVVDLTSGPTPSPFGLGAAPPVRPRGGGGAPAAAAAGVAVAVGGSLTAGGGGAGPSRRGVVQGSAVAVAAAGAGSGFGAAAAGAEAAADAALAEMMAQLEAAKAKLEEERRAKERLQAKVQDLAAQALLAKRGGEQGPEAAAAGAAGSDVLLSAPPPAHWEPMGEDEGFGVKLVVLPLPGDAAAGTSFVAAPGSATPFAPPALSRSALAELEANGLSPADAADLLRHCNGNLDEAMQLAMEAADCGGIMALLKRQRRAASAAAAGAGAGAGGSAADTAAAQAAARAAREAAVREELERVLARFEKASGLSRTRIVRVERVQNWRLWTKYCIRRREIEALARQAPGSQLNEFYMWHGTSTRVVQAVVTDGFDMRESNRAGSLGEGIYFAANASYSIAYSTKHGPNVAAQAAAVPMFAPAVGFALPAPGMAFGAPAGGFGWAFGTGAAAAAAPYAAAPPQPAAKKAPKSKKPGSGLTAFPGKSGAMMLCRVAIGRLAMGSMGMRKPPAGADAVYMAGTLQAHAGPGQQPRPARRPKRAPPGRSGQAAAAGGGPGAAAAAAGAGEGDEDEEMLWHVGQVLGDNFIAAVFDNAQAYPEYIVHID